MTIFFQGSRNQLLRGVVVFNYKNSCHSDIQQSDSRHFENEVASGVRLGTMANPIFEGGFSIEFNFPV
jgi:hypothetical protein